MFLSVVTISLFFFFFFQMFVFHQFQNQGYRRPSQIFIRGRGRFFFFFFFFSSRRRHTRCREVSWARRCVQETVAILTCKSFAEHGYLSLIHISEPTRPLYISYAVFCLKKKKKKKKKTSPCLLQKFDLADDTPGFKTNETRTFKKKKKKIKIQQRQTKTY
eukprot:TRINITY_DN8031_c0_g1_i2.p1 TRINITY_DN8031_c0_g1~~TRINITY_DN8031_c0_g1_i2.p1  ORF type:complete len:161 (+),score=63.63 TRINITY_DN8031_c0_g1_i2:87-569(+)